MEQIEFAGKTLVAHQVKKEWIKEQEIEYKKVDAKRFEERNYQVEKVELPPTNGFLRDEIVANVDLKKENTVIINIGVGQGKVQQHKY